MQNQATDFDSLRETANKIANGDWQHIPFNGPGGKLDFVELERRIFEALVSVAEPNCQASNLKLRKD